MTLNESMTLLEAANNLLRTLDNHVYVNDYCGLEVSKHNAPAVTNAIEALRQVVNSHE